MDKTYGIHWFRRDLRVAGNRALKLNWKQNEGRVLGVFCFDHKFLSRPDFSVNRFQFFLESLKSLKEELEKAGSELLVLDIGPEEAFELLLQNLKKEKAAHPDLVTWNRDYEPFAVNRDRAMTLYFKKQNIKTETYRDHLIIEPSELTKNDSATDGYQVFSPFARKWQSLIQTDEFKKRITPQENGFKYIEDLKKGKIEKVFNLKWKDLLDKKTPKDHLDDFLKINSKKVSVPLPKAGLVEAFRCLDHFKKMGLSEYGQHRDIPSLDGTSKMSFFLKNGSITTSQIIAYLGLKAYDSKAATGPQKFLSELIWREFYYHIIYRNPNAEKESFNPKYKNLKWQNDKKLFEAWKKGMTGFPIVDAGMRQLKTTGWMHNRVRMIVASFLTKDLHIDWRWGEKYFMETLLDGDLAPNNGGWQWAASTGCDPQPYFRIFNPWSQSKKFDPEALYIKQFIPELKDCDAKDIHAEDVLRPNSYPLPIVNHKDQREKALKMYKDI